MNPTEKYQTAIIDAVTKASKNGVHPAIVFTVLHGVAGDVLFSIKQANRMPQQNNGPQTPASPASPATAANETELRPTDATD